MVTNIKQFHKITHGNLVARTLKILVRYCSSTFENGNKRTTLDEKTAYKVVLKLKQSERATLKLALAKYESDVVRKQHEDQLAAKRWRSIFEHPSTSELGGVVPTGAYCPLPDLTTRKLDDVRRPDTSDLWKLFLVNAIPFLSFGFLDNFIMIIAGDYIELAFGTFFYISTLTNAALGNTLSDMVGIRVAHLIERSCEKRGLRPPKLSNTQMEMRSTKNFARWGKIVGIVVGCMLGMSPLLFLNK